MVAMAVDDPVRAVLEGKELAAVEVMVLNLVSNVSAAFSCAFESPVLIERDSVGDLSGISPFTWMEGDFSSLVISNCSCSWEFLISSCTSA